ncbi:MAG: aminotransferase class III-fold pyridoxal phosphate-dependent enzyme [Bacteroidota bacterium]
MKLFEVYPLFDIEPVRGEGCHVWDKEGRKYLDLYGGHAVISIGHSHPHYINRIQQQLGELGFYSNSVRNGLQEELARKLGQMSGCEDYQLFLVNSGAEAVENALKLASFHTGKSRIGAFFGSFHGRTSAAVEVTCNPKISAPLNRNGHVSWLGLNDLAGVEQTLASGEFAAIIIEGIQGVGGIYVPDPEFLVGLKEICKRHGALLILDEVQSGFGRSGEFFAFQHADVVPDIITMAKGMGNGFPVGGILIHPDIQPKYGMLGTTFGGNHLACAAVLAVLEVIEEEKLIENARAIGQVLKGELVALLGEEPIRGHGLMVGVSLPVPAKPIRKALLFEEGIFTGSAAQPNVLRLLPPLGISKEEVGAFMQALSRVLAHEGSNS